MLDIGCGEGRHTYYFEREGFQSFGIDYEASALQRAVRRGNPAPGLTARGPYFASADLFHLPFPGSVFDIVLDYGCLHHVRKQDFERYLASVLQVMKPGGFFLLSCFSTEYKHHPEEKRRRDWLVHKGHYDRFFSKDDFPVLFGRVMEIMEIREEKEGHHAFFHLLMRRKVLPKISL